MTIHTGLKNFFLSPEPPDFTPHGLMMVTLTETKSELMQQKQKYFRSYYSHSLSPAKPSSCITHNATWPPITLLDPLVSYANGGECNHKPHADLRRGLQRFGVFLMQHKQIFWSSDPSRLWHSRQFSAQCCFFEATFNELQLRLVP